MVMCIAPGCQHYNERETCRFFRIPVDSKVQKKWIRNIRRKDIKLSTNHVICQCHFKNGLKENGPTIFEHNKGKIFCFEPPEKTSRKRKKVVPSSDSHSNIMQPSASHSSVKQLSDSHSSNIIPGRKHVRIFVSHEPSLSTLSFRKKLELVNELPSDSHSKIELPSYSHSSIEPPSDSYSKIELPSYSHSSIEPSVSELPLNSHSNMELPFVSELPSNSHSSIELPSVSELPFNSHSSSELPSVSELPLNSQSSFKLLFPSELPPNLHSSVELPYASSSSTILLPSSSILKLENDVLRKELAHLQEERSNLREFSFSRIQDREDLITYYTGTQTKIIFDLILTVCTSSSIKYVEESASNICSVEMLSPKDQLLLTLMRLKLNLDYVDLGVRFNINTGTVSNIFLTWLNVLHEKLYKPLVNIILSESEALVVQPSCYTDFKHCRMVITSADIFISTTKKVRQKKHFYSLHADRHTMKCLIGVSPNGAVIYTSKLFPGSTSDEEVFKNGCLESTFKPGDLLLYVDKAFLITDTLNECVDVNIPHFLSAYQFTSCQVHNTKNIENAIIHVERAIQLIKSFKIMRLFPHTFFPHSTKILQVIVALSNFQPLKK